MSPRSLARHRDAGLTVLGIVAETAWVLALGALSLALCGLAFYLAA